eukprot:TRINITY_DN9608_c0_g1_i1.p1 TRINITY_DN9608_c0_g1~~TRINITY_DN9608_c0_g1_i1.p1  ORF type:complete len:318 (+),score=88.54 TRINITY_DN9608_c0_g1_i1:10-963(+)
MELLSILDLKKTSISCIDDGISVPTSRKTMYYGGRDLDYLLFHLIKKRYESGKFSEGFPNFFHSFDINKPQHHLALSYFKEKYCSCDYDALQIQQYQFPLRNHKFGSTYYYKFQLVNELFLTPLSFFYPDILCYTDIPVPIIPSPYKYDNSTDVFSREYLTDIKYWTILKGVQKIEAEKQYRDQIEKDKMIRIQKEQERSRIPLELAILKSVQYTGKIELRKKLLNNILIVGGSTKFTNFGEMLQRRINVALESKPELLVHHCQVLPTPKYISSSNISWVGGTICAHLDGMKEHYISQIDWNEHGVRALKEKSVFIW